MKDVNKILNNLKEREETLVRLGHIAELLEWDRETELPPKAVEDRAAQIALIHGLIHEKVTDGKLEDIFTRLECNTIGISPLVDSEIDAARVREIYKEWAKMKLVPKKLVKEMARASSVSSSTWALARKNDDFATFRPKLEQVLSLKREYAHAIAPTVFPSGENAQSPQIHDYYDVLLNEYEPEANGQNTEQVFELLETGLKDTLQKILKKPSGDHSFLDKVYAVDKQDIFGRKIQRSIGYDYDRGRLDISNHPFTATMGPHDVRVTTRYNETNVISGLFSNLHEAGHGLYEQGFNPALYNSSLADGAGLGIHESQSRFWENMVGRSMAFWERWYDDFQNLFPEILASVSLESFYRGINRVRPSLVRVEADEVTYGFHIIIRFRLERDMICDKLQVAELPNAWQSAYKDLLGLDVPNDADGCMQDIHWSEGLFGYFPTYALGNLYAAQFTHTMESEIGPLSEHVRKGSHTPLEWLRKNIHWHGRVFTPGQLCKRVSGEALNPQYFLEYLRRKFDV